MEHQFVIDLKRRKFDLFPNYIYVHTQTTIEFGGVGVQRMTRRSGHHADSKPRRSVEEVHPSIDDIAAATLLSCIGLSLIAFCSFNGDNGSNQIARVIDQMATGFESQLWTLCARERIEDASNCLGIRFNRRHLSVLRHFMQ